MSKISAVLKTIEKKMPKIIGQIEESGIVKRIKVDSPQLSFMFGGGLPVGRIIRFRGPESSGKSILCNYCAAQLQKRLPEYIGNPEKKVVVYVDFERTFVKDFAEQVGIITDDEHFIHLLPDDIESANDVLMDLIKTDEVCAVILDSDAAAPTRASYIDPAGKATFGGQAKALGEMIRKLNILCANYNTTLFWISQERVAMNIMAKLPSVTGGEAPKFYASVVNRVTKTDVIKNGNDTIGIALRCRNYKNKCGVPFRDAEMKLYYNGGFDSDEEYIDFLVNFGLIEQKGAYFKSEKWDFSLQGRAKLLEWLHEHEDVYTKLKEEVDELLTKEGVLDANNVAEEEDIDFKSLNNHSSAADSIVDEIIEEQSVYETTT